MAYHYIEFKKPSVQNIVATKHKKNQKPEAGAQNAIKALAIYKNVAAQKRVLCLKLS